MAGLKVSTRFIGYDALLSSLSEESSKAEHAIAVEIERHTLPFVPALTGSLMARSRVIDNMIVYPGPYAKMLYNGKLMIDPNTGSSWSKKGATKVVTGKALEFNHSMNADAQSHWFEASKAQNLDKWLRFAKKAVKRYF